MIKVAGITIGLIGVGAYVWSQSVRPGVLEAYVFDTPGALSVFIRTPNDKRMLINGGSNADIVRRVSSILPFYSRRIDLVIATESADKVTTGLHDITDRYEVGETFWTRGDAPALKAGETLLLDDEVRAEILFPVPEKDFKYSNASYPQILLKIIYGETSIVYAGQAADKVLRFTGLFGTTTPDQVLIHKNMANGINVRKNGPLKMISDGRSLRVMKL